METRIIPRTGDPVWNEAHTVAVAHDVKSLRFLVKDNDRLSAEHVAEVSQYTNLHTRCFWPCPFVHSLEICLTCSFWWAQGAVTVSLCCCLRSA